MTTTVLQGDDVTLTVQWQTGGGVPDDVTGQTITVKTGDGLTTVLGPTSSGITHLATGLYSYTWSVPSGQTPGAYVAVWDATSSGGGAVQASEQITVLATATGGIGRNPVVWYATREKVKRVLDIKNTARMDWQVDDAIETASRMVEGCLHRFFRPVYATRYFDWPDYQGSMPWRLWLDEHEVISVIVITSGGQTLTDYLLEPVNDGPPYDCVQINLASSASFNQGNTHQRNIVITGQFGYTAEYAPAGALTEALDDSETEVEVTDSGKVGVGDVLLVDAEHLIVTEKAFLDTGVDTAGSNLTAVASDDQITLSTTTNAPAPGEMILVDSERMLVVDVTGTAMTVKREYDGSRLATHTSGASIYAPRSLTVTRGALGTTAASHSLSAAITRHLVPGPVRDLTVAYALNQLLQENSGYARVAGEGDAQREYTGRGIGAIEKAAKRACGRQMRLAAV
jgi:hypothetical protein